MKKRYPYLIGACLAAAVLILPGCTPKQSTFAEEKAVQMEKPAKGYNPYMEVSYAYFGSLPYMVGSADAITIASIVKDHGIVTLKEGDGYADYRIYTLKSEFSLLAIPPLAHTLKPQPKTGILIWLQVSRSFPKDGDFPLLARNDRAYLFCILLSLIKVYKIKEYLLCRKGYHNHSFMIK